MRIDLGHILVERTFMFVDFYSQISKLMECICRSEGEVVIRLSYFDLFLDLLSLI